MRIFRGKKLIISLLCVLTLLLTVFSFITLSYDTETEPVSADYTYTFGSSAIDSGTESANIVFIIKDANGWAGFAASVSAGRTFSGKEVRVDANIDFKNATIRSAGVYDNYSDGTIKPFKGEFNGNGKTFSNIKIKESVYNFTRYVNGELLHTHASGLISWLDGGSVYDLCVKNITIETSLATGISYNCIGGIVGLVTNIGNVTTCKVQNLHVKCADMPGELIYVGGVVGSTLKSSAVIGNCEVKTVKFSMIDVGGRYVPILYFAGVLGRGFNTSSIYSCVYNPEGESVSKGSNSMDQKSTIANQNNYSNCHAVNKKTEGLDLTTIWYYNSAYNGGWPTLRLFMSFTKYTFKAGANGTVKVNGSTSNLQVEVPTGLTATIANSYAASTTFNNVPVAATENAGYYFEKWTLSGTTYTANFKVETYKINLQSINIGGVTYKPNTGFETITVTYGQNFVVQTYFEQASTSLYYMGIAYTLPPKYKIKLYGTIDGTTNDLTLIESSNIIPDLGANGGAFNLTPSVELKTYTVDKQ